MLLNNDVAESVLSTASTNKTIAPTAFTGMLHVQGNGATYNAALIVEKSPSISGDIEQQTIELFGAAASAIRYGLKAAHLIDIANFVTSAANQTALIQVLQQAQLNSPLYFRDTFGGMWVVGLQARRSVEEMAPLYRRSTIRLVETLNAYSPSIAQGSAQGIPAQQSGSVQNQQLIEIGV